MHPVCVAKLHMWHMQQITFPFLALSFKLTFSIGRFCPFDKPLWYIVSPVSHGSLLTLSCLCLHCVHSSDLWPLCLCLQITSEVHLFSHTKGKRHQQAVRDSSSIQGRELSDEEVVRITYTLCKKTKRHCGWLLWRGHYYCLCIPLYTATALLLALCDYKWALKCTQSGFSASAEGWHHPLVSRLFLSWSAFPWEGSSLMQGNLSGCNMRLAFQQCSLWGWQLLVLYAAPLAAPSFKAFFSGK